MSCIPQPSRRHRALVFDPRRTVLRNLCARWHALPPLLWLLIKTFNGRKYGSHGNRIHILMFFPRLNSIKPEQTLVCPYQTTGSLHEYITLAYFVFLEELSLGLFSVIGLLGNSDFLSLLAGFSSGTRRRYPATSTRRTQNIGGECLLIIEFR